jgi:hypothetical protein
MDISKLTIKELVTLKNKIEYLINTYNDEYLYICRVRQFGSVWEERPSNIESLKQLCNLYNGDNGIVDVYTNNINLKYSEMKFYNYGDVMYIKSEYDYREWVKYKKSKNLIEDITKSLKEWDERDNYSFKQRPLFEPIYSKEDLDEMVRNFQNTNWDFTEPVQLKYDTA